MTEKKAVVLLSGGLDSMVVAGLARERGYSIYALTIDYNQRHRCELESQGECQSGKNTESKG